MLRAAPAATDRKNGHWPRACDVTKSMGGEGVREHSRTSGIEMQKHLGTQEGGGGALDSRRIDCPLLSVSPSIKVLGTLQ